MRIHEIIESERPYEKLEKYGAGKLSNLELIAIIVKNGTKEKSSIEVANELLKMADCKLRNLFFDEIEYTKIKGIGRVKSLQLKVIGEIIKRIEEPLTLKNKFKTTNETASYLMPKLKYLKYEVMIVLILDAKCNFIKEKVYTTYNINTVNIDYIEIVKDIIKENALRVIIAHNHPSGDISASKDDIEFTKKMFNKLKEFNIELLDHIIIGENYTSIIDKIRE